MAVVKWHSSSLSLVEQACCSPLAVSGPPGQTPVGHIKRPGCSDCRCSLSLTLSLSLSLSLLCSCVLGSDGSADGSLFWRGVTALPTQKAFQALTSFKMAVLMPSWHRSHVRALNVSRTSHDILILLRIIRIFLSLSPPSPALPLPPPSSW